MNMFESRIPATATLLLGLAFSSSFRPAVAETIDVTPRVSVPSLPSPSGAVAPQWQSLRLAEPLVLTTNHPFAGELSRFEAAGNSTNVTYTITGEVPPSKELLSILALKADRYGEIVGTLVGKYADRLREPDILPLLSGQTLDGASLAMAKHLSTAPKHKPEILKSFGVDKFSGAEFNAIYNAAYIMLSRYSSAPPFAITLVAGISRNSEYPAGLANMWIVTNGKILDPASNVTYPLSSPNYCPVAGLRWKVVPSEGSARRSLLVFVNPDKL